MFTRILVPLDGSLCAEQAIPVVVRIARASHGRTGLQRWVMDSVTERVLRMTRLPLLIIRPSIDVVANNEEYREETSEPEVPLSGQVQR